MIDQATWKLKQAKPKAAMFCQECNSDGAGLKTDSKKYLDTCQNIIEATTGYDYIKIGDAAQIWSDAKKNINWNKALAASGLFDMFDMYLQLDEVTDFTGKIGHDTTNLNLMADTTIKLYDKMWEMFAKPIAITQISTSETFQSDTTDIVYESQFMAGAAMVIYYQIMFNYNIQYNNRIQIGIWQTIKNVTGKNTYDINGNFLTLIGNLFQDNPTYLTVVEQSGIYIYGSKVGDEYRLIFLNKTGKELTMPRTISMDGYVITDVNWSGGEWFCTSTALGVYDPSFTTKNVAKYNNTGTMKMGMGYAVVKIPK